VISSLKCHSGYRARGFTLVEIVVTIAIIVTLLLAGVSLLSGTGPKARKSATDVLTGMLEHARTTAITTRSHVLLAVAQPDGMPAGEAHCRIGLFKVHAWPDDVSEPIQASLMNRWRILDQGVVLLGGEGEDRLENPLDGPVVTIEYGSKGQSVNAYLISFNSRGGLHLPPGSRPVVMRIAEGLYRDGKPVPYRRGNPPVISENRIKIGRTTARPYRIDG
jgi:prepilin-type N-terminal cleavage/methylation domain-containing protein